MAEQPSIGERVGQHGPGELVTYQRCGDCPWLHRLPKVTSSTATSPHRARAGRLGRPIWQARHCPFFFLAYSRQLVPKLGVKDTCYVGDGHVTLKVLRCRGWVRKKS